MIDANEHHIGITITGAKVSVPNDPISKLMYYLDCVSLTCNLNIESKLHDKSKRYQLSFEEENKVLYNASIFEPSLFINKTIFNKPSMCGDKNHMFYNVSDISNSFQISLNFLVIGIKVHVSQIMVYRNRWLLENYYSPIKMYKNRIEAIKKGTVEKFRPKKQSHTFNHKQRPQSVQKSNHNNQGNNQNHHYKNKPKQYKNYNKNHNTNNYHNPHTNNYHQAHHNNYNHGSNNIHFENHQVQLHCFHQRSQSVQKKKYPNNHCNYNKHCGVNIYINLPQSGHINKKTIYDHNQQEPTTNIYETNIEDHNQNSSQIDEPSQEINDENEINHMDDQISESNDENEQIINEEHNSENDDQAINEEQNQKNGNDIFTNAIEGPKQVLQVFSNDNNKKTPTKLKNMEKTPKDDSSSKSSSNPTPSKNDSSSKPNNMNTPNQNNSKSCLLI